MMRVGAFNDKIEEVIAVLKKEHLVPCYRKGDVSEFAQSLDDKGFVDDLNINCPEFSWDFDLKMDESDPHSTDYDNVVTLHSALKDLPPAIAANPQFWAWEAHIDFSDYIHNRSEAERSRYCEDDVLRDFFCRIATGQRRALVTNPLSRLWWTGRLLRDDENIDDPYHFVRSFTSSAFNSKILLFASSTAASNHEIAMGMMDAIEGFKAEHGLVDVTRYEILACTKYLNSIGAVRMVDTLSRQEISDLCHKRMNEVL